MYTYSEVVARVRKKLLEYFGKLAETLAEGKPAETGALLSYCGSCTPIRGQVFARIGVVDGGSSIMALNIGFIGIVSAVGVVIENNRVVERVVAEPLAIPEDPLELAHFESASLIESVVDKAREALVFEVAKKVVEKGVDLLIVDGPLVPYGALAKRLVGTRAEEEVWWRYKRAVIDLHERTRGGDGSAVGFVKRPRSRYIARLHGIDGFDHVILSRALKPGEYYPEPPLDLSNYPYLFHEPEVVGIVKELRPRVTYLRLTESSPPCRVDLGNLAIDHKVILSYLYTTRTREGVPFAVMKVDEEAKITRELIRELYDDALHEYIVKYVKSRADMLVPLLPEYGGP